MTADPYWSYVKILCHFDGPDNGKRFADERHNKITPFADAKISTVDHPPLIGSNSSAFFGGTGGYIAVADGGTADLSTLDFTLEMWVKPVNMSVGAIIAGKMPSASAMSYYLIYSTTGVLSFVYSPDGTTASAVTISSAAGKIVVGVWAKVSVVRTGGTVKVYVDEIEVATGSIGAAAIFGSTNPTTIGGVTAYTANYVNGYVGEFRLTVGVTRTIAVGTKTFPGSGATDQHYGNVVLHCHFNGEHDATTIVDQKGHTVLSKSTSAVYAKISTTTNGSKLFGGSCLAVLQDAGPYLESVSTDFNLGTEDFTFEFFINNYTYTDTDCVLLELRNTTDTGSVLRFTRNGNNTTTKVFVNDVAVLSVSGVPIGANGAPPGHIALVRHEGVFKIFAAGAMSETTYDAGSTALNGNGILRLFGGPGRVGHFGFYDDVRLTKGVARYTNSGTPPAEPFPDFALQKLTGTVFDADNNPVAKTVRSYRTSDGLLVDSTVSNATTGAFELRATDTTEHFVVVHDATKNALVYDHIVPVI